jgi:serine/threonine protein kinase
MEQLFGNYRLLPQLGTGGFSNVHLGEDIHSGTQVCIKVWEAKTEKEAKEFLAEAYILNHLHHPNIIRVLDYGRVDDTAFFVTTYAPYGDLQYHYRTGISYPLTTILLYIKQIASTLQYIHDQGVVHCSVHPSHFLLGENHEILLCGFGLARILPNPGAPVKQTSGIPQYMAPEHFRGEVSPASDQYALAVVVYEWLCGEKPFKGRMDEIYYQVQTASPPPLRSKIPTISSRVEQIVLRSLSKDPQQRFPQVLDFANALEEASTIPGQIEIFFSYAPSDASLREKLAKQLAHLKQQGIIAEWHNRDIEAGSDWAYEADTHLKTAHIILLLVSPDFLASNQCYLEMTKALKRHENGEAIVIPIILRPTPWMDTPLSKLRTLPQGGKPITRWSNQDEAFLEVAHGIQKVIQRLTAS